MILMIFTQIVIIIVVVLLKRPKIEMAIAMFSYTVMALYGIFICIQEIKNKGKKYIYQLLKKLVRIVLHIFIILLVFYVVANFVIDRNRLEVFMSFKENGDIIIENTSIEKVGSISALVLDKNRQEKKIENLECNYLLTQNEKKKILKYNEKNNTNIIKDDLDILNNVIYWKCKYKINSRKFADGKYYVIIKIIQDDHIIEISNMFQIRDKKITFCKKY